MKDGKTCIKCDEPATLYYGNHMVCLPHATELHGLPSAYESRGVYLPDNLMKSLHRYIIERCPTGDFLRAVLSNNLFEACGRADKSSIAALHAIVGFIYNHAPSNCHGSPEKVKAWLNPESEEYEYAKKPCRNR
jgi:hypothetical protein